MHAPLAIFGLGTARPKHSIAQADAARLATAFCQANEEQTRSLAALYRRTRIERRGSVLLESANGSGPRQSFFAPAEFAADAGPTTGQRIDRYRQEAPPLALAASRQALERSGYSANDITHLISVTCTGFAAPGFDLALVDQLGLSPQVARTQVGFMGCHGAINALRVAAALANSPQERVLICATELCSLHLSYGWDPDRLVANAIFADGAAALVCGIEDSGTEQNASNEGRRDAPWRLLQTGSCIFPHSADAMTWRIGDHGFEMTLSPRVPDLIGAHLRPWLESWLARRELSLADVRSWAIHPGGPRILNAVVECLRLPPQAIEASRDVLADCGNMSSPTVLFILQRLAEQQAPRPCVALAFGPGLAAEAALLE